MILLEINPSYRGVTPALSTEGGATCQVASPQSEAIYTACTRIGKAKHSFFSSFKPSTIREVNQRAARVDGF
uniref:Uncharacterized protein n=1 Tax=Utricularia reniformis TaxID=192314 RepID=A0A1Y0B4I9_9LAMI|nr:hypothetical protein AEK19_MT2185 [Utricularia reniformis]ART32332.1 hypothetical protein AEK19_MT2185 [Utricularia reniformis]